MFGFVFWKNDYPHGGNFWGMLVAVPIFVSCIVSLGLLFGSLLDMSERAGHFLVLLLFHCFTHWNRLADTGHASLDADF